MPLCFFQMPYRGTVTAFNDFCAFFVREKWRLLAQVSRTSDLTAWLAAQTASPPTLATHATDCTADLWQGEKDWHCSTCWRRHRGKRFAFRLRGLTKKTCPSSRFKISSDGKIDMDSLLLRFVLCALAGFSMDEEAWSQLPGGHYFPTQNGLKIHWISWHCRYKSVCCTFAYRLSGTALLSCHCRRL